MKMQTTRIWKLIVSASSSGNGEPKPLDKVVHSSSLPVCLENLACLLMPVPFMLRNIWTAGLLLFAAIMGSTFFITKVWQVGFD